MGKTTEARILTPEVLGRLTPAGCDPTAIRVDGDPIPTYSLGELAGVLAKCSDGARLYSAVFFRGADEYRPWLMSEIRLTLADTAKNKGWEIRVPGILEGLGWLAISDETPESTRCGVCGGIGSKTIRARVVECNPCNGSGKRPVRNPHKYLGVDRRNWDRTWRPRYERHVRPMMDGWRSEVRQALYRELEG